MSVLPRRDQVLIEETWNLTDLYGTPEDWEGDTGRIKEKMGAVSAYRGRLGEGADVLLACLGARDSLSERLQRVAVYASLSAAANGMAPGNQAMAARAGALMAAAGAAQSFLATELAALPEETVQDYLRDEPALEAYRHWLERMLRLAAHALAPAAEEVLAALGDTLNSPFTVYQRATGVDLICPPIQDTAGQAVPVSIARYVFGLAQSADREVRRRAYESLAIGIGAHNASLARKHGGRMRARRIPTVRHTRATGHRSTSLHCERKTGW